MLTAKIPPQSNTIEFLCRHWKSRSVQWLIQYSVTLHCQKGRPCDHDVPKEWVIIPAVHSEWCKDLVSPMLALLESAVERYPRGSDDKFIFLSGGHIPVKPFNTIYLTLAQEPRSEFCITAEDQWAACERGERAIKHEQWIILNRADQQRALDAKKKYKERGTQFG